MPQGMPIARNMARYAAVSAACELSSVPSQSKRTPFNLEESCPAMLKESECDRCAHKTKEERRSAPLAKVRTNETSELEPDRQLRLTRVSNANAQETVKVKQRRCHERVDIVLVVDGVEHFDRWDERIAFSKMDWTSRAPVKRNVFVVFPCRIPLAAEGGVASSRSNGLRRMGLQARIKIEAARQFKVAEEIEFMTFVAVREAIIQRRIGGKQAAIREGVALVGIVVQVFGDNVVPLELEAIAEVLAHADGQAAVERLSRAGSDEDVSEEGAEGALRDDGGTLR